MIEPQSAQDGASAWVANATLLATAERPTEAAGKLLERLAVPVRLAVAVADWSR